MTPAPPRFERDADYGERLGDVRFWGPYVREVLHRHGLGDPVLESGFVGTFPTFLAGDVVVKLFGSFPGWNAAYAAERAVHERLATQPAIPAPRVLAYGRLFDGSDDSWPYLISERIRGTAWRDARPPPQQARAIAHQLGQVIRLAHDLIPTGIPDDWAAAHASVVLARQRARGRLDDRLIAAIPAYVSGLPDPSERRLIHADLTRDHIFVDGGRLVGVIDWGDAMNADRYYELAALHLDLFERDLPTLRAFLDGYGWEPPDDFERRALGLALLHRFDVCAETPAAHDSLPEMATRLFGVRRTVRPEAQP